MMTDGWTDEWTHGRAGRWAHRRTGERADGRVLQLGTPLTNKVVPPSPKKRIVSETKHCNYDVHWMGVTILHRLLIQTPLEL